MRFSAKLVYTEFDLARFKKTLDETLETQMRQAARAWLRAILTAPLPVIRGTGASTGVPPVWTGTARGTLIPLGRFLRIAIPITPVVKRKGKGPTVGQGLGRYNFHKEGGKYYFRFSTSLPYFALNEFYHSSLPLKHKTPWEGLKVGQKAFKAYLDKDLKSKLPKVEDFLRYRTRIVR